MNNENNELLNNDVEINVSEENIILAPSVELFDEAKEIAQSTLSDEKFPFSLQYDISIHVPLRGGRHKHGRKKRSENDISIHVPLRGGRPYPMA